MIQKGQDGPDRKSMAVWLTSYNGAPGGRVPVTNVLWCVNRCRRETSRGGALDREATGCTTVRDSALAAGFQVDWNQPLRCAKAESSGQLDLDIQPRYLQGKQRLQGVGASILQFEPWGRQLPTLVHSAACVIFKLRRREFSIWDKKWTRFFKINDVFKM